MIQTADERRVAPRAVGKYLTQIAIVFAAQFAAGKLAEAIPIINSGGVGPVWPASGIALAALLLFGYQVWPGVAAAAFLLTLLSPIPPVAAVVYGIGSALAALTGTFLLRRVVNFDPSLSRLRDAIGLIVLGAFGSSVVSASIGVSVLYAVHVRGWSGFSSAWLIYWLGDSMGVLLLAPLVLALPNLHRSHLRARIPELVALLLLLTAACLTIFGDLPLVPVRLHVLAFAVLPFVIWAAIRFGVSGATLSTLFVATIATVETAFGSGPFAQNTPFINAVLLDVFFAVLSVSGMTLAAVIAEREQAEREREQLVRKQAAMEARLRLATIVESTDDAIIGTDIDGIITDWNKGAKRLYGYSASEVIGRSISLLTPPDLGGDVPENMAKLRHGDTISHHETVHQSKDGKRIEVSMTMSPIRDTEGRIVGASVIGSDITERKRQDAIFRKSEERFRLAAQAGKMYAYEWDVATDLVVRSEEHENVLGFSDRAKQLTRQQLLARVHPDDRALFIGSVDQLTSQNPTTHIGYRVLRPDGSVVWLEKSARAFFDEQDRMLRVIGMVADITDRKRAEEVLRESDERERVKAKELETVLDTAPVAIYIATDTECTHITANRSGYELLNLQIGANLSKSAPEDERPKFRIMRDGVEIPPNELPIQRAAATGNPTPATLMSVAFGDGTERHMLFSAAPLFGPDGKPRGAVGTALDVTERKLAEAALASVSRRLIEAQEKERTRIARDLHDDIGQRLALLAIGLEQLQQNAHDLPAETQSRISELRKDASEIATDIQSLSHELHSSRLEYLGITAAMRGFCKEFGEQQKAEADFKARDLPSPLSPDISLCLFRVLQEALHNSAKHSGVRHVEVRLWGTWDEIHLTVRDSGAGFDLEAAREGRGLGLISMEERLKLLNGTFLIDSQPEKGTTVHVSVPLGSGSDSMRAAG
jgi:PAS domain S-box-containing protein